MTPPTLPTTERASELEAALRETLQQTGTERFLSAPLVTVESMLETIDRGSAIEQALVALLERLLELAGVGHVSVDLVDRRQPSRPGETVSHHDAPILDLAECHTRQRTVLVDVHQLSPNPTLLVGALSHLAAAVLMDLGESAQHHPFRAAEDESPSDDVTVPVSMVESAIGLGLIATVAAENVVHSGENVGYWGSMKWSIQSAGDLTGPELAYLLALQVKLRGDRSADLKAVAAALPPNQKSDFKAWHAWLGCGAAVATNRSPSPPGASVDGIRVAWRESGEGNDARSENTRLFNLGRPVFRVRGHFTGRYVGAFGAVGLIVTVLSAMTWGRAAMYALPAFLLVGGVAGSRKRRDVCSDPDCERLLTSLMTTCPGCGGTIAGEIASPDERLEAEEALQESVARGEPGEDAHPDCGAA